MGRKPYIPTEKERNQVMVMAAAGMKWETIAQVLGIAKQTLSKNFKEELAKGKANIDARVFGALVRGALDGCKVRQIFYCKTKMGMAETSRYEHSGPDGGPIQTQGMVNRPAPQSKEEWIASINAEGKGVQNDE